ncbi:unnamed protein product [Sphagnum troendelagicum]
MHKLYCRVDVSPNTILFIFLVISLFYWLITSGTHTLNIFNACIGEIKPFKSFKNRFPIPYQASNSTSLLWHSIKRGSAHIIVLSSYSAYGEEQ